MTLTTFVATLPFDDGKEIRIVRNEMDYKSNACGNILTSSESDVGTTLSFDCVTRLSQHQQQRWDNVVTTLLCQLGVSHMTSCSLPNLFLEVWNLVEFYYS